MKTSTAEFFELCLELGVLKFGEFTLKSGRQSPYFFNSGLFNTGRALSGLARFYASAIVDSGVEFDGLFGPAYKGIPLAAAVSIILANEFDRDCPYSFNRKQAKAYGEGGNIVGAPLEGRMLIVDDVITAGTAIRESIEIINSAGATPIGVAIAMDRQERGAGEKSAIQEVREELGLQVVSVARLEDLLAFVSGREGYSDAAAGISQYREKYGVADG